MKSLAKFLVTYLIINVLESTVKKKTTEEVKQESWHVKFPYPEYLQVNKVTLH